MALMLLVFGGSKTKKINAQKLHEDHFRNVKKYLLLYIYMSNLESRLYGKGRNLERWVLKTSTKSSIPEE